VKLIIQIPCLNEAEQLPLVLAQLPRALPGVDCVEWLVIDDGSTDKTVEVANRHGVDHVVRLSTNKGLATAFQAGLDASLKLGADVIVNTDGDNQYRARDIPRLIEPLLSGRADMVIGDREVETLRGLPTFKRRLQRVGGAVVRSASRTAVPDATSGFRAYNREAALGVQVVSQFTYTLETIIQAGRTQVALEHVPIGTNPETRESRLFPSVWTYVRRNALAIVRVYSLYEPLRIFLFAAVIVGLAASIVWGRLAYLHLIGEGAGHVQAVILGAVLLIVAVQLAALGVLADILAANRILAQRTLERVRRVELALGVEPSHYEPGVAPPPPREAAMARAAPAGDGAEEPESQPARR